MERFEDLLCEQVGRADVVTTALRRYGDWPKELQDSG
jgi:hypothetical protein